MSQVPDTTLRVCIAEDNPILLQGLQRALSAHGYEVRTAGDGPAVLELLRSEGRPDLLILDVMMPGLSGLEVLEAVRADERLAGVPVMLITAAAEELAPLGSLPGGGVEVLMKPFRLNELLATIDGLVKARPREGVSVPERAAAPAAVRR